MVGLLIAIFLGWAGGYRFYKKQIWLGVLYLFTLGLFGIGWLVDIYLAIRAMLNVQSVPKETTTTELVKGVFAKCKKAPNTKRLDIIYGMNVGDEVVFEPDIYKGQQYFLVVDPKTELDIGALPSEVNAYLRNNFTNPQLSGILTKIDEEYPEISLTIKR